MKKTIIILVSLCLLLGNTQYVSHAGTSAPTALWDLTPTAYMEQIGIFTDPVNHRGYYPYSALVNNNIIYSNFYFKAQAAGHYYLTGYELYQIYTNYYVVLQNYTDPLKNDPRIAYGAYNYFNSITAIQIFLIKRTSISMAG